MDPAVTVAAVERAAAEALADPSDPVRACLALRRAVEEIGKNTKAEYAPDRDREEETGVPRR